MIRYSLKCAAEHGFESWFQSSAAFDSLSASGHVACPVCGSTEVAKSLMAPAVRPGRASAATPDPAGPQGIEEALAALRRKIEELLAFGRKGNIKCRIEFTSQKSHHPVLSCFCSIFRRNFHNPGLYIHRI